MELRQDEHEVVRHYERYVDPGRDASSVPLAEALLEAFGTLDDQMGEEGTGVWGRWKDVPVFTCETPLSWERYPDDFIGRLDEKAPPTALVDASLDDHPRAGNGLRISARVPWGPGPQALLALAEVNLLSTEVPGATHTIGAWSLEQRPAGEEDAGGSQDGALPAYVYSVYLPAALADPALAGQDLDLPAIMREVLLTVAREVLLSRRMLAPELRAWEDDHPYVGLAARTGDASAHGLAWGETGEGRNSGALLLDHVYAQCVGDGTDWADTRPDGFTWWPYEQAQDVTSIPNDPASPRQGSVIRMATEVRNRVPVTPEAMAVIAGLNAELGRSVLVLGADGRLFLGCHLAVSDEGPWMRRWAHAVAVDQYATARDLLSRLDALGFPGEPAISAHPFSGPRPDSGELLGIREALYAPLAEQARSSLTPLVALLATAGLGFLPHQAAVRDDGGVDFTWHPSQSDIALPADPAIRVSARPGDTGSGPGWVVRSHVPVAGDIAARARWCNDQNAALLDGPGTTGLHVTGGWGLAPDGECCLTTWLSPFMVTGQDNQVLCLVDLLRDHQAVIVTALLSTGPDAVASQPLTPARPAAGLEEVLGSFGKVIEHPAGYQWAVEAPGRGRRRYPVGDARGRQAPMVTFGTRSRRGRGNGVPHRRAGPGHRQPGRARAGVRGLPRPVADPRPDARLLRPDPRRARPVELHHTAGQPHDLAAHPGGPDQLAARRACRPLRRRTGPREADDRRHEPGPAVRGGTPAGRRHRGWRCPAVAAARASPRH